MTPELWAGLIGAIVLLLTNLAGLVKVWSDLAKTKADRQTTKQSRDEVAQQMHDDLIRMQCKQTEFESNQKILFEQSLKHSNDINELSKQHAEVKVLLNNILETLKEIKDKK